MSAAVSACPGRVGHLNWLPSASGTRDRNRERGRAEQQRGFAISQLPLGQLASNGDPSMIN
jgi:hypothetical protein